MKKIFHLTLVPIAAILVATASLPSASAAQAEDSRPTLSVDGTGTSTANPDMATITIGVTTLSEDAATAQKENANTSAAVQSAVRSLGINAKDIQTSNYSFRPNYQTDSNRQANIKGYTVNNSITVIVRDLNLVGQVIDTSLHSGANEINSLEFSTQNVQPVRKAAMLNAVKDAEDKAEIIAKGLGRKILGIKSVNESTGSIEIRRFNAATLMMAKDATTPIATGSLSLSSNVHIEFILSE